MQSVQEIIFLDLNLYFALVYLFRYYFSKEIFERNCLFSFERLFSFPQEALNK